MTGRRADDDPPPVLRTWSNVYIAVAVYLAGLIGVLYIFTRAFAA